jgi:hypothetical protein
MKKMLITLLLFCFSTINYAGTIDPNKTDKQYLEYGQKHTCVLKILGHYNGEKNIPYNASCVIIDSLHILTAAHVVKNSISRNVIYNDKLYTCNKFQIHEDFDEKKMGYYDIAILKLDEPIILDFYPSLYKQNNELDKICSIAGYGLSGILSRGYDLKKSDGKKRAGSNIIRQVSEQLIICSTLDKTTELEFLICPGDSGGGLFIDQQLAGINSFVMAMDKKTNSNYGDESGHTRISFFIDWIERTKKKLENN